MKAVRLYAAGDLRVEDIPVPGPPAPGWVNLDVAAAGICGSDLHNFSTGQWISRSPSVAGHELAGIVTAIGPGVSRLKVGDTVVADSRFWCDTCARCAAGEHYLCETLGFVGEVCDGGFAEVTTLPERLVHKVNPALSPSVAAMAEPFAVALHAVRRLAPAQGGPVLVLGCGPIGGLIALILSRQHDGKILIAERNPDRLALVARITGATPVEMTPEAIASACEGHPLRAAVDATGSVSALTALIGVLASAARLALVGIFGQRLDLDPNVLVERELTFLGCHAFDGELPEAIDLLDSYAEALTCLIDEQIDLDAVPNAYQRLLAGQAKGLKTIVKIRQW